MGGECTDILKEYDWISYLTNIYSSENPETAKQKHLNIQNGTFEKGLLSFITMTIPEIYRLLRMNRVLQTEDLIIEELDTYITQT